MNDNCSTPGDDDHADETDFDDKNKDHEIDCTADKTSDSDVHTRRHFTEETVTTSRSSSRIKIKHGIRIAQLNIRTLSSNIDDFKMMVEDFELDIITLNETRLSNEISDVQIGINDYYIYRKDRNTNGGGVAIYVNENKFNHKLRTDLMENEIELVAIEVKQTNSAPIIVLAWYRPPGTSIALFNFIENILLKVDEEGKDIIFLGDFNCNVLAIPASCYTNRLCEICNNYSLTQIIDEPTRVTQTTSTLIDLIYTSNCMKVVESGVIHLGMSDHSLVYLVWGKARKSYSKHAYRTYRTYKHFDENEFCCDIDRIDWQSVFFGVDVNSSLNEFQKKFSLTCNSHAPIRKSRTKKTRSPWINGEIINVIHERDKLKEKATRNRTPENWKAYQKMRNHVTSKIRQNKRKMFQRRIERSHANVKQTWKNLNMLIPRKKKNTKIQYLKCDEEEFHDSKIISLKLNDFFVNVGPRLAGSILSDTNTNNNMIQTMPHALKCSFQLSPVTIDEVKKKLMKLSSDKAMGCDMLPIKLIKLTISCIYEPLTHVINMSITSGCVPTEWKKARVCALHKGGTHEPSNYRPISILPIFSKVLERVVFDQLYEYLNNNNLINMYQSGFRPLYSTASALLNITDEWLKSFEEGRIVCAVMLDLKKAFDTVDFDLLMQKLRCYGIDEHALCWFKSYLHERSQFTTVNGVSSDFLPVQCGIPQGSILGPLLFILHINDLPVGLKHCKVSMYADDTILYFASKDCYELEKKVNEDLKYVKRWLVLNKLNLNTNKTEYMVLGTKSRLKSIGNTTLNINIDGTPLKRVTHCKHLGVSVDENLSWTDHIKSVQKKCSSGLYMLKSIRNIVDKDTMKLVYNALISSHLSYCNIIWDNCGKSFQNTLQKLQNRAARIINNTPWDSSGSYNLNKLEWENLERKRKEDIAIMMYNILHNNAPSYLIEKFSIRNRPYNTRSSNLCVNIIQPKTNSAKRTFTYRGAHLWNSLPHDVQSAQTKFSFKTALKRITNL